MDVFVLGAMGVVHWVLLIGLAVVLIFIVRAMMSGGKKPPTAPVVDLTELTVKDAQRGDMLTIKHAAPDYEDLTFKVDKIHRYESGGSWHELAGKSPHGQVALEWEEDDGLQIGLTIGKPVRLEELKTSGHSVTEDDLIRFDEEQSSSNTVEFEGTTYHYDESCEVGFFEDGRGDGEGFYVWDFESEDGKSAVSVEKWEGGTFEVFRAAVIDPTDIQIFRA